MPATEYIEFHCSIVPKVPWADIAMEEMASYGFEAFKEQESGFSAFIPAHDVTQELRDNITGMGGADYSISFKEEKLVGENWNEKWEKDFIPITIDEKVFVRATFHEPKPGLMDVVIQPKMSFGTGHHSSTALMIGCMLAFDMKNKNVLDMGCGTGILAVVASKLGAKKIKAIDNDPMAAENCEENVEANKCGNITVLEGGIEQVNGESFDVVLANINKNTLLEHIPTYATCLTKEGSLIMSGFLVTDLLEINKVAVENELELFHLQSSKQWVAARFKEKDTI